MRRVPKSRVIRDGRGRFSRDSRYRHVWYGDRPLGPHARRVARLANAFCAGMDAWASRCQHHDPLPHNCPWTKRRYANQWLAGVRAGAECSIYDKADDYCECECDYCVSLSEDPDA